MKGLGDQESQQKFLEVVALVKMAKRLASVSIYLK